MPKDTEAQTVSSFFLRSPLSNYFLPSSVPQELFINHLPVLLVKISLCSAVVSLRSPLTSRNIPPPFSNAQSQADAGDRHSRTDHRRYSLPPFRKWLSGGHNTRPAASSPSPPLPASPHCKGKSISGSRFSLFMVREASLPVMQ